MNYLRFRFCPSLYMAFFPLYSRFYLPPSHVFLARKLGVYFENLSKPLPERRHLEHLRPVWLSLKKMPRKTGRTSLEDVSGKEKIIRSEGTHLWISGKRYLTVILGKKKKQKNFQQTPILFVWEWGLRGMVVDQISTIYCCRSLLNMRC